HRVGFRQPSCYGKFSRLLAELITRFSLLTSVLFDAGGAFQSVTSSFDSLIISFNSIDKLPDLYRDCVNHISFESGTCRTLKRARLLKISIQLHKYNYYFFITSSVLSNIEIL